MFSFLYKINIKYVITLLLIAGGGYYGYTHFFKKPAVVSVSGTAITIGTGTISDTIKALGQTALVNEQSMHFNQDGTISKINFKEGASAKKGEIIAEMDRADLDNTIKQNQINLSNAQISLQQLLKGNDQSQILNSQNSVSSLQHKLDQAKQDLANLQKQSQDKLVSLNASTKEQQLSLDNARKDAMNSVANNQDAIDQATRNLADAKIADALSLTQAQSNYTLKVQNAVIELKNAVIDTETITNDIDTIFGFSTQNRDKASAYRTYIGAKDSVLLPATETLFFQVVSKKMELKSLYQAIQNTDVNSLDLTLLSNDLGTADDLFVLMIQMTDSAYKTLTNSIVAVSFTDSQLSGFLSSVGSRRSASQSRLSSILSNIAGIAGLEPIPMTKARLDSDIKNKEQALLEAQNGLGVKNTNTSISVLKAQHALDDAQKLLSQTADSTAAQIQTSQNNIADLERQLVASSQSFVEVKRGPTPEAVATAKNNIAQRQLVLEQSKKNVTKYQIIAPFDGVIREIDYKVGDSIVAQTDAKNIYIQNPDLVEVAVLLDQTDIIKVAPGMHANLEFYSYPGIKFDATISTVTGLPVTSGGVTSYKAKLILNKSGKTFYSGMTQNVTITLSTKSDIVVIPNIAISTLGNAQAVILVTATGAQVPQRIKTGLTDGLRTEVISGLSLWDKVIVHGFSATGSGSAAGAGIFGGLRVPGAGGGGGGNRGGGAGRGGN